VSGCSFKVERLQIQYGAAADESIAPMKHQTASFELACWQQWMDITQGLGSITIMLLG
jgi:hypothetical protein